MNTLEIKYILEQLRMIDENYEIDQNASDALEELKQDVKNSENH